MRPIMISTDVLAALWTRRKPSEESENDILARLLGLPRQPPVPDAALIVRERGPRPPHADGGIFNTNFRVKFPQGFEIFRTYKGKQHRAVVQASRWIMDGRAYPSLFALSQMVSDSNENPWMHWKYRDEDGAVRKIGDLRGTEPIVAPLAPPAARKPAKARTRK
jgi:hypothetical protein